MSSRIEATGEFPKDNLYKRLGTRSNISQGRIREKYIAKLREFPPETHPEEFRRVREAYEILSRAETRTQYDAARQSKHSWSELLEAGSRAYDDENYPKAERLLEEASRIRPTHFIYMTLAHARLYGEDDLQGFKQFIDQALELAEDDKEACGTEIVRVVELMNHDQFDEGVDRLFGAVDRYPHEKSIYYKILPYLASRAHHLDSFVDTHEIMERLWPERGQESVEDLPLFRHYLDVIDGANRWDRKSQIVARLKSLAKNLQDERDVERAKMMFEEEFDEYEQLGRFKEAELATIFLLELDRHDVDYKEWNASIKEKVAAEKAYKKLMIDDSVFPGARTFAEYWFFLRYLPPDAMPEELEELADIEAQTDFYGLAEAEYKYLLGYGLHQIRKKHPEIYKFFREEWDELLAESTEGLSRKERRSLK